MPKRDKLLGELVGEDHLAALLMAQAGGVPNELQLMLETAQYDEDSEGLRPNANYIIRVLGALEYRIDNIGGTVESVQFVDDDHPLLYEYNTPPAALFFRGQPDDVNELIIDISQAHASTFQGYRPFPTYLNIARPLVDLFGSGGGLVGQMPMPLAERLLKVLERHGLETKLMQGGRSGAGETAGFSNRARALLIGSSYFVSYAFSVEELGEA